MKKIISYLFTIVMAISLIAIIIITIISNTILNCEFTLNMLNKNNYYELVDMNIKGGFESYIKQSGLEKEVFDNIYSSEKIKNDIDMIIKNTYGHEETKIEIESIKEKLKSNIDEYLQKENIKLSKNEKKNMENYIEKIADIYDKEISHPVYLDAAKVAIQKSSKIIDKYKNVLYAIPLVLLLIILIINIKEKLNILKYIAMSMLIAGSFILLGILIINLRINIQYVVILNANFSLIVINIIKNIINKFIITSIVVSVIAIIIDIIANICQKEQKD